MAKRQPKQKNQEQTQATLMQWRERLLKFGWLFLLIVAGLFGYAYGYPIAAQGNLLEGILTGVAYGAGALLMILAAIFLNRKMRGL